MRTQWISFAVIVYFIVLDDDIGVGIDGTDLVSIAVLFEYIL